MKSENIGKILESYRKGTSTLEEEKFLKEISGSTGSPEADWLGFAGIHRKEAPLYLEERIINSIRRRSVRRRRVVTLLASSAATLLIAVTLALFRPWKSAEMDYDAKMALYLEALKMVGSSSPEVPDREVIYEDGTIVIYLESDIY